MRMRNMDSLQLDQIEFEMLKGTETMVNMIRNRKQVIGISNDVLNDLLNYLDSNAEKLYYVRTFDHGRKVIIYFESPIDKENVTSLMCHYSEVE